MKAFNFIFSLFLMTAVCTPATSWAQSYDDDIYVIDKTAPIPENETKKERKERIKKDHEIVDSIYHLKAELAAEDGYFVLQATEVRNSYGHYELGLNDNTNFMLMQGDKGIFQVSQWTWRHHTARTHQQQRYQARQKWERHHYL